MEIENNYICCKNYGYKKALETGFENFGNLSSDHNRVVNPAI